MRLFDSHCHLTAEAFDEDRNEVLARAESAGVTEVVTVASDPEDAAAGLALCRSRDRLHCTAGLHPHEAERMDAGMLSRLEELVEETDVVAVGETGLDFHYDHSSREGQSRCFEIQLDLAARASLPVVVHSRDADAEMAASIGAWSGRVHGVLHCFTGGPRLLDVALDAGWLVSFSGIATFRRYADADLLRRVPDDRLLIETDSPYLAPVPVRGRRNEPAFLVHTCAAVAALRGQTVEAVAEATRRNAGAFYGLAG